MRKIVLSILILGVAFSIGLVIMPSPKPKEVPQEILSLPSINLLLTDSATVINTSHALKKKATVLFYFDPGCEHCQQETENIIANKDILKKVCFYFISLDSMRRIKSFMEHYKLRQFSEITVSKDYQYKALSILQINKIPTNIVYNKKRELVKIFEGGMSINDLINILEND